jgi:L-iditol 2-dehydrogenase
LKVVAIVDERKTGVFEIDRPVPGPNQVLVRIKACALCTFEQRVFTRVTNRALPWVGGHECAGVIEEIGGEVDPLVYKKGAKAALRVLLSCGECYYCRRGRENLCTNAYKKSAASAGTISPNGLGEYLALDAANIFLLEEDIKYETAVFAEPLACVVNSIERGQIGLGDDVVILGGGVMGMLHILCAKLSGARVIMSEPDEKRAGMARKIGADFVINPLKQDPVQFVKDMTGGRGADVVFNTTALASLAEQAIKMTGPMGRFVMYSSLHPDAPISISPNWLHNTETVLTGSKSPSVGAFDKSVRLLNKKLINVEPLLTEAYDYTEADKAFERAVSPETFRVMIRF